MSERVFNGHYWPTCACGWCAEYRKQREEES